MSTAAVTPASEEAPKSIFEKAGAALPVALTMLATTFAGMSTSELQQAMFWRSFAAQDQAKATSQWSLAGFKRDRALICETTAVQLRVSSGYTPASVEKSEADSPEVKLALEWLSGKGPPRVELPEVADPILKTLLTEIRERKPEAQILATAAKVTQLNVNKTIDEAEERVDAIDKEWDPTVKAAKKLVEGMVKLADPKKSPAAQAVSYDLENRRYRAESVLNQGIGYLYEARVKVSTAESDKHRRKSTNIFYAMLAAQIGATISSLALARQQKSLLWLFAGLAGLVSIGIAAYITLATA